MHNHTVNIIIKRLYGEFHFDDTDNGKVESTFNKNAFQDQDFINYCINALALEIKKISFVEFPGKKFNLPLAYNKEADEQSWNEMKMFFEKFLN